MRKLRNTLYVITPDKYLSLDGENIVMHSKDDTQTRLPLHNVEDIVIFGGRGASPALMNKCTEDNIGLTFMSRSGKFLARAEGAISGNVYLRREQFRIADDEARSLSVAKNFIIGKLYDYVHSKNNDGLFLKKNISCYADDGFYNKKYTEIVAECFSAQKENIFANEIINILRGDGI